MFGKNLAAWCDNYNREYYAKQAARKERLEARKAVYNAPVIPYVRPVVPSAVKVAPSAPSAPSVKSWTLPSGDYNKDYAGMLKSTHILIAGTTGSGKSVVLNGIMHTALTLLSPNDAEFILVDPKMVELASYENLPHTVEYLTDDFEIAAMLERVYDEMMDRYAEMKAERVKKYTGKATYIIIDELADLMTGECSARIEKALQRLLQKARAANIHIIAATQAPNRQVIPAGIVLNFTDRIALRCLSSIESRQILNVKGAEQLTGYGKALYLSPLDGIKKIRIPFYEDEELDELITFWEEQ